MAWVEVFAVFIALHLLGDFLFQTEWQALNKRAGLGANPVARRALVTHVTTYTLAFIPAFVWIADDLGAGVLWVAALVFVPHLLQDDGRALSYYMRSVKGADQAGTAVAIAVDQSFHVLTLLGLAMLVAAAT